MPEPTAIRVPLDNVNDDTVKLTSWLVREGDEVREGQLLAEVETSKALVEMVAPVSGKVWLRAQVGHEIRVGAIIAFITVNGAPPPPETAAPASGVSSAPTNQATSLPDGAAALPAGTSFSKKALELMQQRRLAPEVFAGRGLVREQDIQQYLSQVASSASPGADLHIGLRGLPPEHVTLPPLFSDLTSGVVSPAFLEKLRSDPEAFGKLSSAEKCELYRKHGAVIGEGAKIGARSVIIAPQIILGEEAEIAEDSSIVCRERFCIGPLTSFCRNLHVRGGSVVLGEDVWAGQNIRIGGGGHADPWSVLCVGDNSYLGDDLYLNICRAIVIGTHVFLTQRTILMTHNVGHSLLEGYENRFAPIILGDYSQVGMHCTVYAGSVVGPRAIVGSNSYVISSIPEGKLAIGVPARVVRDAARHVDRPREVQLVHTMMREFHELLGLRGHQVAPLLDSPYPQFNVDLAGKRFQLLFIENLAALNSGPAPADETVVWTLDSTAAPLPAGCTVMNLLAKEISGPSGIFASSSREFLRKRGIRLKPGPWRYRKGLI